MTKLLVKNAKIIATMDGTDYSSTGRELHNSSIYCEDWIINNIFNDDVHNFNPDLIIDASNHVVIPGLINTHHHLFQTLTKAVSLAQNASLFDWLKAMYPIWSNITPEDLKSAVKIGLSELILSGCTTSTDHLYIYPNSVNIEDEIEDDTEIGIRFHPTRGSMSIWESNWGLPPDN